MTFLKSLKDKPGLDFFLHVPFKVHIHGFSVVLLLEDQKHCKILGQYV